MFLSMSLLPCLDILIFTFFPNPLPSSFVIFLTFLLPIPSLTLSPSLHCLVAPIWKLITWNCQKWKLWTKGKMGQNEWQKKIEEEKKRRWKLIKVAMLHLVARDAWRGLKIFFCGFGSTRTLPYFCHFRLHFPPPSCVTGVTSRLFSIIWWFRPWKPYIFWTHVI